MKTLLTAGILTLVLAQPVYDGVRLAQLDSVLELKATKEEVLAIEERTVCIEFTKVETETATGTAQVEECVKTDVVTKYAYISDTKAEQITNEKGVKEDLSKRTENTVFFEENGVTTARIYAGKPFVKQEKEWKVVEFATTTKEAFELQTKPLEILGMEVGERIAYADTLTQYSGSGDGVVYGTGGTWETSRNTGTSPDYTGTTMECRVYIVSYNNMSGTSRSYPIFDTSSIAGGTVTSANVYLYVTWNGTSGSPSWDDDINLTTATRVSNTSLSTTDYTVSNLGTTKLSDTSITYANRTAGAYINWSLNSSGISAISTSGYTSFVVRQDTDIDNTIPSGGGYSYRIPQFSTSEETGTGQDPYISVTYTAPQSATSTIPVRVNGGTIRINGGTFNNKQK